MKFSIKALRTLSPCTEKSRMEFRKALAETEAHATDLSRAIDRNFYAIVSSLRKHVTQRRHEKEDE